MTNRTRKEFAEYLKMDVKSLADKIRYQEKKIGKVFGQDFTDTKIYTEQEQYQICKLLEIPCFHVEVHTDLDSELLSEKQREMMIRNFKQMSELISLIDDVEFVKLDGEFAHNVFKKIGQNYIDWAKTNKNAEYDFQYERLTLISEYLAERD